MLVQISPALQTEEPTSSTSTSVVASEHPSEDNASGNEAGLRTGMRASSYVIYVDLPDRNDEMLLLHGYTGAYDQVSRNTANFVRSLERRRPPKPLYGSWTRDCETPESYVVPSDETLKALRRRGYLTELSVEDEEALFSRFVAKIHSRNLQRMPTYIFMPTYDCNLRCSYCFQDHMRTKAEFRHLLKVMSTSVIDRIFQSMPKIEALHGTGTDTLRSIGFFGGEPLLAASRSSVEYILRNAWNRGSTSIWAVSNATELEAYEDLLGPNKIDSLQITLDGPPQEHDKRRIYPDGSGSFHRIAHNITMALDKGVAVSVRLNIDRNNVARLPELAEVMHTQGWSSYSNFSAYTAPIHAANEQTHKSSTFDSWGLDQAQSELEKQFSSLSIIDRPNDNIKQSTRRIFNNIKVLGPNLKESFCSAHSGMYIFDTFGDIYACWERTGDPSIRIGHVAEDGSLQLNQHTIELWRSRTVSSNPVCRQCRYALHCGGGCAVLAVGGTGKYHMNYCDGFASVFRAGVAEAYLEHLAGTPMKSGKGRVCDQ